jgi:hypothetical protein
MTISLSNYLTDFQYEISPPGQNLYPAMTNGEALSRLIAAFWSLRISGIDALIAFTCDSNGNISPQTSSVSNSYSGVPSYVPVSWYEDPSGDVSRAIIQAILLFAHLKVLITVMENANTSTTYRAGSVEASTQKSSTVYQAALKSVTSQLDLVLSRLSDLGATTVTSLDAVIDATVNIADGVTWWTR